MNFRYKPRRHLAHVPRSGLPPRPRGGEQVGVGLLEVGVRERRAVLQHAQPHQSGNDAATDQPRRRGRRWSPTAASSRTGTADSRIWVLVVWTVRSYDARLCSPTQGKMAQNTHKLTKNLITSPFKLISGTNTKIDLLKSNIQGDTLR